MIFSQFFWYFAVYTNRFVLCIRCFTYKHITKLADVGDRLTSLHRQIVECPSTIRTCLLFTGFYTLEDYYIGFGRIYYDGGCGWTEENFIGEEGEGEGMAGQGIGTGEGDPRAPSQFFSCEGEEPNRVEVRAWDSDRQTIIGFYLNKRVREYPYKKSDDNEDCFIRHEPMAACYDERVKSNIYMLSQDVSSTPSLDCVSESTSTPPSYKVFSCASDLCNSAFGSRQSGGFMLMLLLVVIN